VRYWLHAEHLIVNGEKMSKSLGNFYTLRDLIARGHRPTAIRYLLASVPYRKQLNFTFAGLQQAQHSIARLRNFRYRLAEDRLPSGENPELQTRAQAARQAFEAAMDDNLNTAEALAAIFDLVRDANTAMDRGEFRAGDRPVFLDVLERWDRVFAVLEDTDHAKLRQFGFAKEARAFANLPADLMLDDREIEKRLAERDAARRRGEFARADKIRADLLAIGVILEDTKSGTRWKRK
jgi:cysteinyl-tRNA synthetase